MAKITVTNGDSDFDRDIVGKALRLVSGQPSPWVIRVGTDETTVHGTVAEFDGTTLVVADMDDEDQHTGAETTLDIHDINEVEVF
jgi:hypothetical protein